MFNRLVLFDLFVLCLSVVGKINGQPNDDVKAHLVSDPIHQKSRHHIYEKSDRNEERSDIRHDKVLGTHQVRHHHHFKTRQGNGSLHYNEQLVAVANWLNGTKELQFLYNELPSCIASVLPRSTNNSFAVGTMFPPIFSNGTFPPLGNVTSVPEIDNNFPFSGTNVLSSKPSSNTSFGFPIFRCLVRRAANLTKFPELANIFWKAIFLGVTDGCNKSDVMKNIRDFCGCNGTFGTNLFNVTFWKNNINSPANAILALLEHDLENWLGK